MEKQKEVIQMLNFVLLVVAIVLAQFISAGLALLIMFNPKVMNWYMKKCMSMVGDLNYLELDDED